MHVIYFADLNVATPFDLFIVGIFMIMEVLLGLAFSRMVRNGSDFFRAGARGAWWMVGTSMFVSGISSYTFVANAAGIFRTGWTPIVIYLANACAFLAAAAYLGPWYRQMRVVTYAEAIRARFGRTAEQVVTHLLVINGLVWSGVGLYTLAVFLSSLIPGASVRAIILAVGIVMIIYSSVGGHWAVLGNDFVQALLLMFVTVTITFLCLARTGGVSGFLEAISNSGAAADLQFYKPAARGQSAWSAPYGLAWLVVTFLMQFANQCSLFQATRYFAAKDGSEARKASLLACILMGVGLIVFFVPPIYARVFLEAEVLAMHSSAEKAAEYAYSIASIHVLPPGTVSLLVLAIFAVSSPDAGLTRNSALIVRDLLPAYRKLLGLPPVNPDNEVQLARLVLIVLGTALVGVAIGYSFLNSTTIFDVMLTVIAQLITPQVIPLCLFLFIRKVPRWAIFSSLIGGYIPSIASLIFSELTNASLSYPAKAAMVLAGGVLGFVVARPFWVFVSPEEKAKTADFYSTMNRPVEFAAEVGQANDALQLSLLGRFTAVLGVLLFLLVIPASSSAGRWVIVSISIPIFALGILMWIKSARPRDAGP